MARIERDREDLLANATALVRRVELSTPESPQHIIVGFRANGCGSVYFGQDVAYQFNSNGQMRRAHRQGVMFKAESGRLVSLRRRRDKGAVVLDRHALSEIETERFLVEMSYCLDGLRSSLESGAFDVIGQVPVDEDLVAAARCWLTGLPAASIAQSPHVR